MILVSSLILLKQLTPWGFYPLTLIVIVLTTSTPKIGVVRYPPSIGSTYIGLLDFIDNQDSDNTMFGYDPVMIIAAARNSCVIE